MPWSAALVKAAAPHGVGVRLPRGLVILSGGQLALRLPSVQVSTTSRERWYVYLRCSSVGTPESLPVQTRPGRCGHLRIEHHPLAVPLPASSQLLNVTVTFFPILILGRVGVLRFMSTLSGRG